MHLRLRQRAIRAFTVGALALSTLVSVSPVASAKPALWVVHSTSATIYLFGTFHMLPPHTNWHSPVIDKALQSSDEIWTEADIESLPAVVRLIHRYGLDQRMNLEEKLAEKPKLRRRYQQEMASAGVSVELYNHVKPWLAGLLLTGGAMKQARFGYGVEADLMNYAKKHGKQTPAFETPDEQFALLADLPEDAQFSALEQQINDYDKRGNILNTLVNAWLSGNDERLDELSNQELLAHNERYFNDVIVRRNERFAERIVERLQGTGTAFVAVGAAHLCGSASVQALLKNYGVTAERVPD
jgi:uncharacterized protein YbaP (TraB family)